MSNTDTTIEYDSGTTSFDPPGPFQLHDGDTLTLSLGSGFPDGSVITELRFFQWDPESADNKGPELGTWKSDGTYSGSLADIYKITAEDDPLTEVEIEDQENPTSADSYALEVLGNLGSGGTWDTDPELINNPGT